MEIPFKLETFFFELELTTFLVLLIFDEMLIGRLAEVLTKSRAFFLPIV
jgi:hypothetical protein